MLGFVCECLGIDTMGNSSHETESYADALHTVKGVTVMLHCESSYVNTMKVFDLYDVWRSVRHIP